MKKFLTPALIAVAALSASAAHAADAKPGEVIRYANTGPNAIPFPIAKAVEVPAGKSVVYLSGQLASKLEGAKASDNSQDAYGNTEQQTLSTLTKIQATLKEMGLDMKDVVKMTVFLKGDPEQGGKLDFAGMMKSYTKFFGTKEQPNVPARSAVQVAALAAPQFLIEIEVIAVRP
ncbi:RidA family protein [Solimonas marina]|uniref:RidA family protein n=1 Tax=Solimonas marina TaxID=2714601 RepID=UPI003F501563